MEKNFKEFEKFSNWKIKNPKSSIGEFYNKFSKDVLNKPEITEAINKTCKSISSNIIAEKGKTISDNRKRIKINEEIAKQNRKKYIVRRAIKVKSKEKEDNIKNNSD